MNDLPYFEDIFSVYFRNILNILFPQKTNYKLIVYLLSIFHIIGTIFIPLGLFYQPKYLILHFIYLLLICISYKIFNNYCFMTLLTNKITGNKNSPLSIRMNTAKFFLYLYILTCLVFLIFPDISFYNILKKKFS